MTVATRSEAAFSAYRQVRYFGSLDGIRCLCIVMVLWHHSPANEPYLPMLFERGFTGVNFFFILSGFLITTLLLREEDRDGRFSLIGFYRRRALRILPVYFLVVTLSAIFWIGVRGEEKWWDYLIYYYLFLVNFLYDDIPLLSQTWSLSVEEQYYIIWPTLLLLLPALRVRAILLVVLIVYAVAVAQGLLPQIELAAPTDEARFLLPVTPYSAILIGTLTGVLLHTRQGFDVAWRVLGHRRTPVVLFAALLVAWQFLPVILRGWPEFVMHVIMALLLASVTIREDHALARILRWPPVQRIGVISYGLYLWHFYGLHIGNEVVDFVGLPAGLLHDWIVTAIFMVAAVAIAEVSFRYYESVFLNWRYRRKDG